MKATNPVGIIVDPASLYLNPGTTRQLRAEFDPLDYYDQRVTWSSDKPGIAKVSSTGVVTAVSPGTATIKAKTKIGGKPSTCAVTVGYGKALSETRYHFYGIGNDAYPGDLELKSCVNDVEIMADAVGPEGADFYTHLHGVNQDRDGILSMLYDMMTNPDADEDDVSVFYYSGHGVMSDTKTWRGALVGTDMGLVTVDEVQYYLDRTPGTIVVILASCLSGQFITSKSVSPALQKAQVAAFGDAWINSFASSKTVTSKALTTSPQKSRFKILTAAEAMESSWGADSVYGYGWFTKWAAGGIGRVANSETGTSTAGPLAADADHNNAVTLNELYNYVKTNLPLDDEYAWWTPFMQQHVQVWPANDITAIVNKNA